MKQNIKEQVVDRLLGTEGSIIREVFEHKGRTCVIIEMFHISVIGNHHNGYVETRKNINSRSYNKYALEINTDELTFSGSLYRIHRNNQFKNKKFFGFDSAHYWNTENPHSQTFGEVKKRTIKLCKEMVRKGL